MWLEAAEVYAFALRSGLTLILRGAVALGLRLWIAPVGYWRLFVNAMVVTNARRDKAIKILDLSSPKLVSLLLAAGNRAEVTATDLDDPRIFDRWKRIAELLGIAGRYKVEFQDAQHLTYPDESFDFVYSISVVEHIPDGGDRAAIREIHRVLRAGGSAVVEVPFRATFSEHSRTTNSRGAPSATPVFYERHYDLAGLHDRLTIEEFPCEITLLGERMPIDPWISGDALPRWLRIAVSPLEPLLAFANYTVITPERMHRPLAAVLTYRKPDSASLSAR